MICKHCGKQGHVSSVCPHKPPEQIHAITTAADPDDASESSDDGSVLILAQYDDTIFDTKANNIAQDTLLAQDTSSTACQPISSDLLLIDTSQDPQILLAN